MIDDLIRLVRDEECKRLRKNGAGWSSVSVPLSQMLAKSDERESSFYKDSYEHVSKTLRRNWDAFKHLDTRIAKRDLMGVKDLVRDCTCVDDGDGIRDYEERVMLEHQLGKKMVVWGTLLCRLY